MSTNLSIDTIQYIKASFCDYGSANRHGIGHNECNSYRFRSDRRALQLQRKANFIPATRPKVWKSRCMAVIRKSVDNRLAENMLFVSKSSNVARHSRISRRITLHSYLGYVHIALYSYLSDLSSICFACSH